MRKVVSKEVTAGRRFDFSLDSVRRFREQYVQHVFHCGVK